MIGSTVTTTAAATAAAAAGGATIQSAGVLLFKDPPKADKHD